MSDSKGSWLKGAFLLTVAGLISKVLSAGYRIPLQNLTGDVGFYVYQQVYPLLGMAMVLSLYGFPSAISKLTADTKRKGYRMTAGNFYLPLLFILFIFVGVMASVLFMSAEHLAGLVGDARLERAYRFVAISLLVIPFTSLLRGVHQGNLQMKPTAYSQIGEQITRVVIIIGVAVYVSMNGLNIYRIGEGAVLGNFLGSLVALFILIVFIRNKDEGGQYSTSIPWRYYIQTILLLGLIAALNHMVLLLFQFADAFTLVPALQEYGLLHEEAMEAKGVLDRGQPLIQLGTVLGSSFALAMIPSLSKEKLEQQGAEELQQQIRSGMKIGFYLAVGATAGLIAIMPEANILLFQDTKGTNELRILVIAILLSSLGITGATILQGLGWMKRSALFILIAVCMKWLGNMVLVPMIGITGSAYATIFGLLIFLILVLYELKRKMPMLRLTATIHWPTLFLATSAMLLYIFVINQLIPDNLTRMRALIYVGFVSGTGALIYLIALLRGRAFISQEIRMLPFSRFLMRIYKGVNK